MSFAYTVNIPQGTDIPRQSAPLFAANFSYLGAFLAVDHTYSANSGGTGEGQHKWVRFTANTNPMAGDITNAKGVLFVKNDADTVPQLWFANSSTIASPSQLTANVTVNNSAAGISFLPGGALMQWGVITAQTDTVISFNTNFKTATTPYTIQCTIFQNDNNRHNVQVKTSTNANFTCACRNSSGSNETVTFTWIAIGNI